MPRNPTTSHKKGKAHYAKKKYSLAAVRAHVTDAMKFDLEHSADEALKAIENHAKQQIKFAREDAEFEDDEEEADAIKDAGEQWKCVLECVTEARAALTELESLD